jgi:small subunit ribosomal protein S4
MSRYRGPAVKISRREGVNLTESAKVAKFMERRPYAPGQHGQSRRGKPTDYAIRLRAKQTLRLYYNVGEKQFANLFAEASKKTGSTGTVFLQLLESRLDNVVYRMGIASTRRQARQFVGHGHILVNGKRVDVPSYTVKPGDEIAVHQGSKDNAFIKANLEQKRRGRNLPWFEFDVETARGKILSLPSREDIVVPVNELLVIEYYSR